MRSTRGRKFHTFTSKEDVFERFYGRKVQKDVSVLPPLKVKSKGSGSRIKSRKNNNL